MQLKAMATGKKIHIVPDHVCEDWKHTFAKVDNEVRHLSPTARVQPAAGTQWPAHPFSCACKSAAAQDSSSNATPGWLYGVLQPQAAFQCLPASTTILISLAAGCIPELSLCGCGPCSTQGCSWRLPSASCSGARTRTSYCEAVDPPRLD